MECTHRENVGDKTRTGDARVLVEVPCVAFSVCALVCDRGRMAENAPARKNTKKIARLLEISPTPKATMLTEIVETSFLRARQLTEPPPRLTDIHT